MAVYKLFNCLSVSFIAPMIGGGSHENSSDEEDFINVFSSLDPKDIFQETKNQQQKRFRAIEYASAYTHDRPWGLASRLQSLRDSTINELRVLIKDRTLYVIENLSQQTMVWDCALVLAKFLENTRYFHEGYFKKKHVMELGCGVGVPGFAAAVLGAASVLLTDMPHAIPWIQKNIHRNLSLHKDRIAACALEWGDSVSSSLSRRFDIILCSDLIYGESEIAQKLIDTIVKHSHSETVIVSVHEERFAGDHGISFFTELKKRSFQIDRVPMDQLDSVYRHPLICVHIIRLCL